MNPKKLLISLRLQLQQFQSETFFITTGLPGIIGPMASLNNMSTSIKAMQLSSNALKKGAVTACDCARSVCKPVDDLFKHRSSPYAYQQPTTYSQPQYAPMLQPTYTMHMPPMIDPTADNPIG
jgi:hypothetical protein